MTYVARFLRRWCRSSVVFPARGLAEAGAAGGTPGGGLQTGQKRRGSEAPLVCTSLRRLGGRPGGGLHPTDGRREPVTG